MEVTIGVCAYNEEGNISRLLDCILKQDTHIASIREIIVVSSACTDSTDQIVLGYTKKDKRINLIIQEKRSGKIGAINELIRIAKGSVIVVPSADIILERYTIENLCRPFLTADVGIVGGRPVPIDEYNTLCGFIANLTWALHHELSLKHPDNPKIGEIYAFRNLVPPLPEHTISDEDTIRLELIRKGYHAAYAPDALVYNKGPSTLGELIKQRKRWNISQLLLMKNAKFSNPGWSKADLIKLMIGKLKPNIKTMTWLSFAVLLEIYIRLYSLYYVYIQPKKRNKFQAISCWEPVPSTKKVRLNK